MNARTIERVMLFKAEPTQVYGTLVGSKKHSKFTESKCLIGSSPGESFTAYDGYIAGENIEAVPGKRIVQSWHADDWPEGHFSEAIFELETTRNGTKFKFTHKGVPEDHADEISEGWKEHYWEKMKAMLEKRAR